MFNISPGQPACLLSHYISTSTTHHNGYNTTTTTRVLLLHKARVWPHNYWDCLHHTRIFYFMYYTHYWIYYNQNLWPTVGLGSDPSCNFCKIQGQLSDIWFWATEPLWCGVGCLAVSPCHALSQASIGQKYTTTPRWLIILMPESTHQNWLTLIINVSSDL